MEKKINENVLKIVQNPTKKYKIKHYKWDGVSYSSPKMKKKLNERNENLCKFDVFIIVRNFGPIKVVSQMVSRTLIGKRFYLILSKTRRLLIIVLNF